MENRVLEQNLTGYQRDNDIEDDERVIEFTDFFCPDVIIFFDEDKIKPTLGPFISFYPVYQMNQQTQGKKGS